MMRRGPLSDYPIATVLGSAAAEKLSGSITVERSAPVGTVYLVGGRISGAVVEGVDTGPLGNVAEPNQASVQTHIESVVALLSGIDEGWYHHDPIDTGAVDMGWRVDVAAVLDAADRRRREAEPLLRWAGAPIRLVAPGGEPDLGPDAWKVIVAMTPAVNLHDIHAGMGWDTRRLATAMAELEAAGLLTGGSRTGVAEASGPATAESPDAAAPGSGWKGRVTVEKRTLARPTWSAPTQADGTPEADARPAPQGATTDSAPAPEAGPRWAGAAAPTAAAAGEATATVGAEGTPDLGVGGASDAAPTGRRGALKRLIDSLRT